MFRGRCTRSPSRPLDCNILIDSFIHTHGHMMVPAVCFSIPSTEGQQHDKPGRGRGNKHRPGQFVNDPLGEELSTRATNR